MLEVEVDIIGYDLIQCFSFDILIVENEVKKVDLIYIDMEGYDYEVLKFFLFSSFQFKVVIFEYIYFSSEDRKLVIEMLEKMGYIISSFGVDIVVLIQ